MYISKTYLLRGLLTETDVCAVDDGHFGDAVVGDTLGAPWFRVRHEGIDQLGTALERIAKRIMIRLKPTMVINTHSRSNQQVHRRLRIGVGLRRRAIVHFAIVDWIQTFVGLRITKVVNKLEMKLPNWLLTCS